MRKIALFSCIHAGSQYAVLPPGIFDATGAEIKQNPAQVQLYRKWEEAGRIIASEKCDTIINFGDTIEGGNRKENANLLSLVTIDKQCEAAGKLLGPIVKGKKYYYIPGSAYHDSVDTKADANILSRVCPSNKDNSLGALAVVELVPGLRAFVTHGAGPGAKNRSTNIENYLVNLMVQAQREQIDPVGLYIQGHLHTYRKVEANGMLGILVPAWKIITPDKIHLKNPTQMLSDIGFVILTIHDKDRFDARKYLFGSPRVELATRKI